MTEGHLKWEGKNEGPRLEAMLAGLLGSGGEACQKLTTLC